MFQCVQLAEIGLFRKQRRPFETVIVAHADQQVDAVVPGVGLFEKIVDVVGFFVAQMAVDFESIDVVALGLDP